MRILLTVHQFFPDYKAGTEVLTLSVAKELIKRGHDVRVFTGYPAPGSLSDAERFDEYDYDGIHIYRFHHAYVPMAGQSSMIDVGYNNMLAVSILKRILSEFLPDLVHHFHLNRLGIGLINTLADKDIPQYFTPTDFWMICPTAQLMLPGGSFCSGPDKLAGNCVKHFAQDALSGLTARSVAMIPNAVLGTIAKITRGSKLLYYPMSNEVAAMSSRLESTVAAVNRLQGIIAPNRFMYDLFSRYGVKTDILHESAFGIEVTAQTENLAAKSLSPERPLRLGFIGTLAPHKGCHVAINALNMLGKNRATLKIFGSGADFPEYMSKLHALADSNDEIAFCGTFPNAKITDVLNDIDVLIIPSVWFENTPLVIYSAQLAKCPIIGSDLPGISAVVTHGHNGLLFKAGDEHDLLKQIEHIRMTGITDMSNNAIKPKTTLEYIDNLFAIWGK